MSLYLCSECGVIENTALGAYYGNRIRKEPVLCSLCGKGEWHGRFPRQQYDPAKHADWGIVNPPLTPTTSPHPDPTE